jgi:hypothetical protein
MQSDEWFCSWQSCRPVHDQSLSWWLLYAAVRVYNGVHIPLLAAFIHALSDISVHRDGKKNAFIGYIYLASTPSKWQEISFTLQLILTC